MQNFEKNNLLVKTLKQALDGLNEIPNHALRGEFKNSYALCAHINKVIREIENVVNNERGSSPIWAMIGILIVAGILAGEYIVDIVAMAIK